MIRRFIFPTLILLLLLFAGCNESPATVDGLPEGATPAASGAAQGSQGAAQDEGAQAAATPAAETDAGSDAASATATPLPTATPTATPVPLAALVNNAPIALADYEAALDRFDRIGVPLEPGEDLRVWTLDYLIDNQLMRQAAPALNVTLTEAEIEAELADAIAAIGGEAQYEAWLAENGFVDSADYRALVEADLWQSRVFNAVTRDVPFTVEMARARFIQLENRETAEEVLFQLQNGGDFLTLLDLYSVEAGKEVTRGDLGYFERGGLAIPEIDAAAWSLDAGAYSDVIEATWFDGEPAYFIVQTVTKGVNRPIDSNRRRELTTAQFAEWLASRRAAATIEVMIGFD